MAVQLKSRQTGMSFMGIVLVGALLVSAFAVFLQLMPVMSEHSSVKSAVKKAALAPTPADARTAFDKIAAIVFSNQIQENNICFQHFCTMCNLFFVNMS